MQIEMYGYFGLWRLLRHDHPIHAEMPRQTRDLRLAGVKHRDESQTT